jgi:hypothetical protein
MEWFKGILGRDGNGLGSCRVDQKSDPKKMCQVKNYTRTHTHGWNFKPAPAPVGFRVPVGFINGLAQSSLCWQNELNELDQMHHFNKSFQSQV